MSCEVYKLSVIPGVEPELLGKIVWQMAARCMAEMSCSEGSKKIKINIPEAIKKHRKPGMSPEELATAIVNEYWKKEE